MLSKTDTFDRQAAIDSDVIHDEDHVRNRRRLKGMYGRVAHSQNRQIIDHCIGQRILDVGAGYGNLTWELLDRGKTPIGIEVDEEKIEKAIEWFGVELVPADFYAWDQARDGMVDTVVFREVLNHLDLDAALSKAFSITRRRCLVFQGTEILPLRLAKRLYGHVEFNQKSPRQIVAGLMRTEFVIRHVVYRDPLAYPLSGGYCGHCWTPSVEPFESLVMSLDHIAARLVNLCGLGRHLCFRVLIVAEKPDA